MYSTEIQERSIRLLPLGVSGGMPEAKPIATGSSNNSGGRLSPDGLRIVYDSIQSGSTEIWVSNLDGTHALQLTNFGGPGTGSATWSPDGRRIAFDSRIEGRPHIYLMPAGRRPSGALDGHAGGEFSAGMVERWTLGLLLLLAFGNHRGVAPARFRWRSGADNSTRGLGSHRITGRRRALLSAERSGKLLAPALAARDPFRQ